MWLNFAARSRYLWRAHRARWRDERAELAAASRFCDDGAVACDIGANKGSYTYWLAKWAERVVAFEPQPALAEYLRSVAAPNVTVENYGVYSRSGTLGLSKSDLGSPGASLGPISAETISVPVVALDDYFSDDTRISLLKIDVEGAEMEVFRGAERILLTSRPALLFECEQRHAVGRDAFEAFHHLERLGYRGRFFCNGTIRPISEFRPEHHQGSAGPYCNNFLFQH